MTPAVVWKEWREQAAVVAALVVLGCGLIAAVAAFVDPTGRSAGLTRESFQGVGVVAATMLALAAGTVVGATLFAGEREAGTFAFLDRLPGSRWGVWWRKVLAGLALAAAPAAAYGVAARLAGIVDGPDADARAALLFAGVTFFGFAWGAVGSVLSRTSLGACAAGMAAAALTLTLLYVGLFAAMEVVEWSFPEAAWRLRHNEFVRALTFVAFAVTPFVLPLLISAFAYTVPDRDRATGGFARVPTPSGDLKTLRFWVPRVSLASVGVAQRWKRLAWLLVRQHRVTVLWLGAAALAAGCLLLIPEALFITTWPGASLILGVLIGVALFADEQSGESARFWGERRLRVGGVWSAKLALGFALVLASTALLLVPSFLGAVAQPGRSPQEFGTGFLHTAVFAGSEFPFFGFLLLGPVYGLVFGQLAGLLFRKAIVAAAVGLMVGGMAAALWLPSLFAGGVEAWQLWTPALVALAVSRLLAWPWATGRLATRGPLLRLAGGMAAVALALAVGIAERAVGVPEVAEVEDDLTFSKSLPSFDEKQAGRDVRRAVAEFQSRAQPMLGWRSEPHQDGRPTQPAGQTVVGEVYQLLDRRGYPAGRPVLDEFLEAFDGGEWEKALLEASRKPTGVYIDPNETYPTTHFASLNTFQPMAAVYLMRGLKAQAGGDPADFVGRLEVLLAVVRTTRASGPAAAVDYANAAEAQATKVVGHWLAALRGRPDLLRGALAALTEHERIDPSSSRRTQLAQQTIVRNGVAAPGQWLPQWFSSDFANGGPQSGDRERAESEATVVGFFWSVPWEKERLRRAVGFNNLPGAYAGVGKPPEYLRGTPGLWPLTKGMTRFDQPTLEGSAAGRFVPTRAAQLLLALRLFEAEAGKFPAALDELVPKYLAKLPADPFAIGNGTPFQYRLSAGETIAVVPPETVPAPGPPDPLALAFPADQSTPDGSPLPARAARSLGAVAGSAVFWGVETPLVDPEGNEVEGGWPGGPPAGAAPKEVSYALTAAPGQPVVYSVGYDRQDNGGAVHVNRGAQRYSTQIGDVVFVVPLPAKPK